jgi:multidrug efflux pump subunit AcrB
MLDVNILKSNQQGSILRLKDVAKIELGAQDYSVSSTFNNEDAVAFAIYLQPGANALETANLVKQKLEELDINQKEWPPITTRKPSSFLAFYLLYIKKEHRP